MKIRMKFITFLDRISALCKKKMVCADTLSEVWQTIYYETMKTIWDGVLSDPVMDYCDVWIQRNCQLSLPSTIISITPDNIKTQDSHETSPVFTRAKCITSLIEWFEF
jgi:hypothetical protein